MSNTITPPPSVPSPSTAPEEEVIALLPERFHTRVRRILKSAHFYATAEAWAGNPHRPFGGEADDSQETLTLWLLSALQSATARAAESDAVRTERNLLASRAAALQAALTEATARAVQLESDHDALFAERTRLREALFFFASVIQSGESWTPTCDAAMAQATRPIHEPMESSSSPSGASA